MVPHVDTASGITHGSPVAPTAIFAGLTTLDVMQLVERMPAPNEKTVAAEFLLAAGGPAANAAVAFAAAGGSPTLVTALPDHPLTPVVTDDLVRHGVTVVVAAGYDGPPITASILVQAATGERAVVSPSSTAASGEVTITSPLPAIDGAGAVLVDGYFRAVALPLAAEARQRGVPVIMDGGSVKAHTEEVLAHADVAVVSADFAPEGTGGRADAVLDWLSERGLSFAAVTRGGLPIVYRTPEGDGEVEVAPVPVRDTLGAGDFFHGALTARIAAQGLDAARFAADLAWAAEVAGRSLASFGTRAWLAR